MTDLFFSFIIISICIGLLLYYLFNFNPAKSSRVKDLYAEGLDLLINGKRKAAYKNFKDIIEKDSENVKAYLRLGQVLREGGNPKQALKIHKGLLYRKKLNDFDKIELHKNLALDYYYSKNNKFAIVELNSMILIDKKNEWAISFLVKIYKERQEWHEAGEYLAKYQWLTKSNDNHQLALYKIQEGRILIKNKNYQKARNLFEDALSTCNDFPVAYYFIGKAYSAESEDAYQQSLEKDKNYIENDAELSENFDVARDLLSKAIPMWIRYTELKPKQSWMVIHLLKDGLFALDRFSEFEDILKQIIKIDRDNIDSIASLSEILLHRGEETEAMELIDSAIEQDSASLLVQLIKMKHQAKKEKSSNNFIRELDNLIHFLVNDERFHIYKDADIDEDIKWLYENSYEENNLAS